MELKVAKLIEADSSHIYQLLISVKDACVSKFKSSDVLNCNLKQTVCNISQISKLKPLRCLKLLTWWSWEKQKNQFLTSVKVACVSKSFSCLKLLKLLIKADSFQIQ